MTRYIIVGAGAVGATLAAQFHLAGIKYALVARGQQAAALSADGLHYVRPDGERTLLVRVARGPGELTLSEDDTLIVTTKAQDAEAVFEEWAWLPVKGGLKGGVTGRLAADAVPVVTAQNGLAAERRALRRFATVIGASIRLPVTYLHAGEVVCSSAPAAGLWVVGRYPAGGGEAVASLAADLRRAGFLARTVPDIGAWKAAKLVFSNIDNAVDLLAGTDEERAAAKAALRAEAIRVLNRAGQPIADLEAIAEDLPRVKDQPIPGHEYVRSTLQGFMRNAPSLEVDFLNGEIVLLARLHGVPAPLNTALQAITGGMASQGGKIGSQTIADLWATGGGR